MEFAKLGGCETLHKYAFAAVYAKGNAIRGADVEQIFSCAFKRERVRENRRLSRPSRINKKEIENMNRFTEIEMRGEAAAEVELAVPAGVAPSDYVEGTFGAQPGTNVDIPSGTDVDFSCVIKIV